MRPGEIVLFNSEKRSVYLLNHTAAAVIRLTDGARNIGWITREIARDFDAETEVVARDIKKIYQGSTEKGGHYHGA